MFKTRLQQGAAITAVVVSLVGGWEGYRSSAYYDPVGIPTICFGETRGVKIGMTKTRAECEGMFTERLIEHEKGMVGCLSNPAAIPDKTYGAFLSFTYNVGIGAFCKSTLAKKANAGDLRGACDQLLRWTRARGRVLRGLENRRKAERELCLAGLK